MTKKDKITVDDIIGIVHTDEPTDSVEEVRKLRGRNERFMIDTAGTLIDMVTRDTFDYVSDVVGLLNGYDKENEQLKHKLSQQEMEYATDLHRLSEENEQLRKDATTLIYANQDYRHENEQLKKRNNNQYNQLTELWQIIEEENWEKLIAMKKQLKEDEERLQKEWVCYE